MRKRTKFGQPLLWAIIENAVALVFLVAQAALMVLGAWKLWELL